MIGQGAAPAKRNSTLDSTSINNNSSSSSTQQQPAGQARGDTIRVENKTSRIIKAVLFEHDSSLEWYPLGAGYADNVPGIFSSPESSVVTIKPQEWGDLTLPFGVEKAKLKIFYPETIDVPTQSAGVVHGGQTVQFTGSDFVSADNQTLIGAAGVGAVAGMVLMGPITAVGLAGFAAYSATQKTELGAITQSIGKSAKVLTDSAIDVGTQAVDYGYQAKDSLLGPTPGENGGSSSSSSAK